MLLRALVIAPSPRLRGEGMKAFQQTLLGEGEAAALTQLCLQNVCHCPLPASGARAH